MEQQILKILMGWMIAQERLDATLQWAVTVILAVCFFFMLLGLRGATGKGVFNQIFGSAVLFAATFGIWNVVVGITILAFLVTTGLLVMGLIDMINHRPWAGLFVVALSGVPGYVIYFMITRAAHFIAQMFPFFGKL